MAKIVTKVVHHLRVLYRTESGSLPAEPEETAAELDNDNAGMMKILRVQTQECR